MEVFLLEDIIMAEIEVNPDGVEVIKLAFS